MLYFSARFVSASVSRSSFTESLAISSNASNVTATTSTSTKVTNNFTEKTTTANTNAITANPEPTNLTEIEKSLEILPENTPVEPTSNSEKDQNCIHFTPTFTSLQKKQLDEQLRNVFYF